jgi:hypothetical protein
VYFWAIEKKITAKLAKDTLRPQRKAEGYPTQNIKARFVSGQFLDNDSKRS